jgi:peptidoglycan hydrolase CwlO-like protein
LNLKEITTSVAGRRELYKLEIDQLTKSIEDHQKSSNYEIVEIKNGIRDVKKDISELKQRIKTGGEKR